MAAPVAPPPPLMLAFADPLNLLSTKQYDYGGLSKQNGGAAAAIAAAARPDFLAELSFHRGAISAWLQPAQGGGSNAPGRSSAVPEAVVTALAALAARLHGLTDALAGQLLPTSSVDGGAAAAAAGDAGAVAGGDGGAAALSMAAATTSGLVKFEWTSALSNKPQRMLRLDSLPQELAMVYAAYAAAIRQVELQRLAEAASACRNSSGGGGGGIEQGGADATAAGGGAGEGEAATGDGTGAAAAAGPGSAAAAATAAVASLRRAAGVYDYLATAFLPHIGTAAGGGGGGGDRPLELLPAGAALMRCVCLAEAQALVAAAAAAKGMSYGTQRALHAGCVTLLRQAEDARKQLAAAAPQGLPAADRLARLLAVAEAAHAARCHACVALERQRDMDLGEAEAACEEAQRLLEAGLKRCDRSDPPSWAEALRAQAAAVAPLAAAVHKDRLSVTYQPLPKQPPDALASPAVKAAPEPFQPPRVAPPAPPAEQAKGGCVVM